MVRMRSLMLGNAIMILCIVAYVGFLRYYAQSQNSFFLLLSFLILMVPGILLLKYIANRRKVIAINAKNTDERTMQTKKMLRMVACFVILSIAISYCSDYIYKVYQTNAKRNNFTKNIAYLSKTIEYNPKDPRAYMVRGFIYCSRATISGAAAVDDINRAIADYTKAIGLKPNDVDLYSYRGDAYTELTNIFIKEPDIAKIYCLRAIPDYTKVIELKPIDATAYFKRSACYITIKNYDLGLNDMHKAQELGMKIPPVVLDRLKKYSDRDK